MYTPANVRKKRAGHANASSSRSPGKSAERLEVTQTWRMVVKRCRQEGSQQGAFTCLRDLVPKEALNLKRAVALIHLGAVNWEVSVCIDGELGGRGTALLLLVRNWSPINKSEEGSLFLLDIYGE